MDQLTIPVLANQDMHLGSAIGQGHHELTPMPEGDNDAPPLPIQLVHLIASLRSDPDDQAKEPDQAGADQREHRQFEPVQHRRSSLVSRLRTGPFTRHTSRGALHGLIEVLELHRMEALVESPAPEQLLVRANFHNATPVHDYDPIRILHC